MLFNYSTFVNKGNYTEPLFITKITDKNNNIIEDFSKETNKQSLNDKDAKVGYFNFAYSKTKSKIRFYIMFIKALFNQEIRGRINFAIQKFPNLTVDEIEKKISSIAKIMKIKNSFEVKEIYPGSFLIKMKK